MFQGPSHCTSGVPGEVSWWSWGQVKQPRPVRSEPVEDPEEPPRQKRPKLTEGRHLGITERYYRILMGMDLSEPAEWVRPKVNCSAIWVEPARPRQPEGSEEELAAAADPPA